MRKKHFFLVIVLLIAMTGCGSKKAEETNNVVSEEKQVQEEFVNEFGTIVEEEKNGIYIQFPIVVSSINVRVGDVVHKGDVLAVIDDTVYKEKISAKEKELKSLQSKIEQNNQIISTLNTQIQYTKNKIAEKQRILDNESDSVLINYKEQVKIFDSQIALMQEKYEMNKALYEAGSISEQELKILELDIKNEEQERNQVLNNIAQTKLNLENEISDLRNTMEVNEIQLSNDKINNQVKNEEIIMSMDKLKSEIAQMKDKLKQLNSQNGNIVVNQECAIVTQVNVTEGSPWTGEEGKALIETVATDKLIASINVPQDAGQKIKIGDKADVTITGTEQTIPGEVERISYQAEESNGDTILKVDVRLKEVDMDLIKLGYEVEAVIYVK
nr:HlyD family efflux transporter periplasmic adaptor subunit [uncultured Cellulosilyticum sp.]